MTMWNIVTPLGRIGRGAWWALVLNALAMPWMAMLVGSLIADGPIGVVMAVLVSPVSVWVLVATSVKRLHDLNRGGIWLMLVFVPFGWIVLLAWLGTSPGAEDVNAHGPPESGSPFGRPEFRAESA